MSNEGLSKKEAAYLAKMQAAAGTYRPPAKLRDSEIEEIRRWEGSAAADAALRARSAPLRQHYTPVSRINDGPAVYSGNVAPTNTMAILALVFGIGGGVLGIIFGHIALSQIYRTGESGRGLAVAGLVCGYLGLVTALIILIGTTIAVNSFR